MPLATKYRWGEVRAGCVGSCATASAALSFFDMPLLKPSGGGIYHIQRRDI